MRRVTDFQRRESYLVADNGDISDLKTFDEITYEENARLAKWPEVFTGQTTEHTPPDVAFRYLMSRSFAKPGMDIGSQTDRALAELAEYRKTLI